MRYRPLGSTGMHVSTYCLGAMMFGGSANADHDDCVRMINVAIDAGVNFVDTADVYSRGESETIVGKGLLGRRDEIILATKVHAPMGDDPNLQGNSRRWIAKEVDASLRRLQTDWIDLYQIHRPDLDTDIEETLSALTDLVHQGKVRAIGCSTFPPEMIVEAHWAADRRGLERFRCEQPPYSILARGIERSELPLIAKYDMGAIVWGPLSGGWLTGRYREPQSIDLSKGRPSRTPVRFDPSIPGNQRKFEVIAQLQDLADRSGIELTHLAIAFVITHPAVTSAIIGPRTLPQLEDLLKGSDVVLTDEILDEIDAIVPPGTNVSADDRGWETPVLGDLTRRRRPLAERSAV